MSKLKLASDEQFSNLRPTPLPPNEDEEGEFELEKILDHDEKGKCTTASGKIMMKYIGPHGSHEPT